jgi:hypothetical protein
VNERRVRVSSLSLVVAVSTFEQRTKRRYNNTHCTYGVSLQHEGSISELHCAKSFFNRAREDCTFFFANNNTVLQTADRTGPHYMLFQRPRNL